MSNVKADLTIEATKKLIEMRFRSDYFELLQSMQLLEDSLSAYDFTDIYLKFQRYQINCRCIDVIKACLSKEKRDFFVKRYERNEMMTKIAMDLNVSVSQLSVWNNQILNQIYNFSRYRLTLGDLFDYTKVINMRRIIASRIEFFEKYPSRANRENIDQEWLRMMYRLYDNYGYILKEMDDCRLFIQDGSYYFVIASQLEDKYASVTEIADICHVSPSAVSRYKKIYEDKVSKYIMSDEHAHYKTAEIFDRADLSSRKAVGCA